MGNEEAFIPGIFNYCDRWCERCEFVSRCRVGAAEEARRGDPAARDSENAAFWEHLRDSLEQTKEMIAAMARERGIDLEKAMAEDAARPRKLLLPSAAHRAVLRQAKAYFKKVDAWFDANKPALERKEKELISTDQMELPGSDPEADAGEIKDAIEIIGWYAPQIYVKLQRASRRDGDEDLESADAETASVIADAAQYDSDGSAKVALIGIDRSLAAWGLLHKHLPDAQHAILDLLLHLDRLRRATEAMFPTARAFIRPGFDEPF